MNVILPERRRARRYLTLKNAGLAVIALIVAFILLSLWSEFRPHSRVSGELMHSRMQLPPSDSTPVHHPLTIVDEGPIDGSPGADSLLLDQAAQDQLRAAATAPAPQTPPPAAQDQLRAAATAPAPQTPPPAAQDQLRAAAAAPAPQTPPPAAADESRFEHRTSQLGRGQRITISGGSEGVQLHVERMPEPAAAPAQPIQPPQPPR